jgi:hypothetical protein
MRAVINHAVEPPDETGRTCTVSTEQQQNAEQQEQHYDRDPEKRLDEARDLRENAEGTEKPEVEDKHREKAKEMAEAYQEERPTVAMPDTDGTVSGTAVADWVDDAKSDDAKDQKERADSDKD